MIVRRRDRLDTWVIGPWWLRLTFTTAPFAFSFYAFRRRIAWKPIDYARAA